MDDNPFKGLDLKENGAPIIKFLKLSSDDKKISM